MIKYFIDLLNNKITRTYLVGLFGISLINSFMFESISVILFNKFFTICFIIFSLFAYFFNTFMINIKEQYILNYLHVHNTNTIIKYLEQMNYFSINNLTPTKISDIIFEGNIAIDELLLLIESVMIFLFKIIFNTLIIIFFRSRFFMLMILTGVMMFINIFWLINNKKYKTSMQLTKLHNFAYYLIHDRVSYLTEFFNSEFKDVTKNVDMKSYTNFVYINFAIIALYSYLGHDSFDVSDKLYIAIYAKNVSSLYALIQDIAVNYLNFEKHGRSTKKIFTIPIKKHIKQTMLQENFSIKINKLKYINNDTKIVLQKTLTLNHNDKVILLGESGTGKTTLINIFKGLIVPEKINLNLDGVPITNGFLQLEKNIMLVNRDSFKYLNESIKEFIFEDYKINYEVFNFLSDIAEMKNICNNLDDSLDSQSLSHGEIDRLILIKSLYQCYINDMSIILLDGFDSGIHQDLFENMLKHLFVSEYYKDKMFIVVSHNVNLHSNDQLFSKRIEIIDGIIQHS